MFQSWYLAVDYHLFIISPLIIYPLWRKRKFGESLLIVCTLLSMVIPFWITFKDNLDPTLMAYPPYVFIIVFELKFLTWNVYQIKHNENFLSKFHQIPDEKWNNNFISHHI